jgi:protein-disulfide isomerase
MMSLATIAGMSVVAIVAAAIGTANPPATDRGAIEAIVRDYILANPEIIPEALEKLQERQEAELVRSRRTELEAPFGGAWAGAKDADVVLVEFFDYSCEHCRRSVADVNRLLAEDKKLKIVFRELPILGDDSDAAAKVSLAAAKQGRFLDFHQRMYSAGHPEERTLAKVRKAAGVTEPLDTAELSREIQKNIALAQALNLTGTPSFVVGDRILRGAVGYDDLKQAIATVRDRRAGSASRLR